MLLPKPKLGEVCSGAPERAHGHAKAQGNRFVNSIWIQARVNEQACCLSVREEDSVDCKPSAIADNNRRLLDLRPKLQGIENNLHCKLIVSQYSAAYLIECL